MKPIQVLLEGTQLIACLFTVCADTFERVKSKRPFDGSGDFSLFQVKGSQKKKSPLIVIDQSEQAAGVDDELVQE